MLSADEGKILRIVANPAAFGEAVLRDRDGSSRRYRSYQREDLECKALKIVHKDGRDVGKTIDVSTLALWYAFAHPGHSVLVAAPYQGQLDTIIDEVEFQIDNSDAIGESVAPNSHGQPKIRRKPYYQVSLTNGSTLYFRPAGAVGAAFRSLHVEYLLVDEAAWIPEAAWKALRQCLKGGGRFRVYSTPNGKRDTTYYRLTELKTWQLFEWPSWISPNWTDEREHELVDFYGGKDSPGWQHEVAGEHGSPAYGAFDTTAVIRSLRKLPEYQKVTITGESLTDCTTEFERRDRVERLLNLSGGHGVFWLGGDLGYTSDPCELLLFAERTSEDDEGRETRGLELVLRVHVEQVAYPVVTEIIALLDRVYHPAGIGVDRGGNGMSVVQELVGLDKYSDLQIGRRLEGYDFGGSVTVGQTDDGKPLKKRAKVYMTDLINRSLHRRELVLPRRDNEIEDQLCTQTYTLRERSIVYSKGNDHIVDALRCVLMVRAEKKGLLYDGATQDVSVTMPELLSRPLP